MPRSGQGLFLPLAKLKQREKASAGHFLCCIAAIFMLKNIATYHIYCFYCNRQIIRYRRFGNIQHTYTVRDCSPEASKCLGGAVSFYFFFCTGNQISSCASSCLSAWHRSSYNSNSTTPECS